MSSASVPVAPPRDERWHWRSAFLVPAVVAPPWVLLGRGLNLPLPLPTAAGAVVVLLLGTVVYTDLRWRRIPNWATYTAALWALVLVILAAALGEPAGPVFGVPAAEDAFGGFLAGFVVMLMLFSVFGGGAGDVKLVAALGGLLGLQTIMMVMFYGYIVAGAFALGFVVWKVGPFGLLAALGAKLFPKSIKPPAAPLSVTLGSHVPMAPFLAAGVILAVALA